MLLRLQNLVVVFGVSSLFSFCIHWLLIWWFWGSMVWNVLGYRVFLIVLFKWWIRWCVITFIKISMGILHHTHWDVLDSDSFAARCVALGVRSQFVHVHSLLIEALLIICSLRPCWSFARRDLVDHPHVHGTRSQCLLCCFIAMASKSLWWIISLLYVGLWWRHLLALHSVRCAEDECNQCGWLTADFLNFFELYKIKYLVFMVVSSEVLAFVDVLQYPPALWVCAIDCAHVHQMFMPFFDVLLGALILQVSLDDVLVLFRGLRHLYAFLFCLFKGQRETVEVTCFVALNTLVAFWFAFLVFTFWLDSYHFTARCATGISFQSRNCRACTYYRRIPKQKDLFFGSCSLVVLFPEICWWHFLCSHCFRSQRSLTVLNQRQFLLHNLLLSKRCRLSLVLILQVVLAYSMRT